MTDYTQLIESADKVASELDDFNSSLDRKARMVLRETAKAIEALQARVLELEQERDEADRRAGFAERKQAADSDALTKMRLAQDKRKVQLGYDTRISFDVVFDVLVKQRDTALAKLAEVEGQEPVAWGVGHDNQWGQRVWFDFTASLLLAGDVAAKHCTQFNSNAEPFPLFARPVIAAGAQPSEAPKTYMQGYSDGKAWALEEAAKVCKQLETAIDGGGNTYYRPADARQCVEAIRKLGEGL